MPLDAPPQDAHQPAAPLDDFDTSFFPAPSPFYQRYTAHNLSLPLDAVISDVPGEPEPLSRAEMEPPNVDWIVEEGTYSVFGETWPIEEKLPSLEEMGVKEMFKRGAGAPTRTYVPIREECEPVNLRSSPFLAAPKPDNLLFPPAPRCRPQTIPPNPAPHPPPHLHTTARRPPRPSTLPRPSSTTFTGRVSTAD